MNDKIQRIIENQKIRNRLHEIGIYSGEVSKSSNIGATRIISGINRFFSIQNGTDIVISTTGVFEVTLCGRISGVTEDVGTSFCLCNSTKNEIISDLNFKLDKGTTSYMDFCEVNVADIYAPAVLNLKTVIDGTPTSDIKFTEMNVIFKSYNV